MNEILMQKIKKQKIHLVLANIFIGLILILSIIPILILGHYNYPSGDDWSYASAAYHAVIQNEGFSGYFKAIISNVGWFYKSWECRYTNSFLASLNPCVFGEHIYRIVPYFMIGILFFSHFYFSNSIFEFTKVKNRSRYFFPAICLFLFLAIQYIPDPTGAFYWWTGAINYLFIYSLTLILTGVIYKINRSDHYSKAKQIVMTIIAYLLCIIICGNNFETSIASITGTLLLCVIPCILHKKDKDYIKQWLKRNLPFFVICVICQIIVLTAPGFRIQMSSRLNDSTASTLPIAILSSFKDISIYIIKIVKKPVFFISIFIMIPLIINFVNTVDYSWRMPILFTLSTFIILTSMCSVNVYARNDIGSGYSENPIYLGSLLFIFSNLFYWIGWIKKHIKKKTIPTVFMTIYISVFAVILGCTVYLNRNETTFYNAYRYINPSNGYAQAYSEEWEERLDILHNDSIKDVVFDPLNSYGGYCEMYDFQPEGITYWINNACAAYYNKNSITLRSN